MTNDLNLYFQYRCEKGLKSLGLAEKVEYQERLKYEIEVITRMGFPGYFLIVSDILTWAKANKIPVGPGRGSAAGSLVAYSLGITHPQIDPIRYNLLFERFLNPDRVSMPDIDLDFCELRRGEVIQYIRATYGDDCIAHIGTYGSMKAKGAIRETARILGYEYAIGDDLSKLTLPPIAGKAQTLETCYKQVQALSEARSKHGSPQAETLKWAEKFEDRLRNFGTHASGIVIADRPIHTYMPLYPGKDGTPTTQFEMENVEEAGLIKFDILGIRALTTIQRCIDLIEQKQGVIVDIDAIGPDDTETYTLLQAGDTDGVFQLEGSSGIRDLVVQVRPACLEDLAALVAIYRPGPLASDALPAYLSVRAGLSKPTYLVPELEPILERTAGWLIYQEQILEMAKQLAGYTGGEADELRKAVGKKKQKLMDKHEKKFKDGIVAHGLDRSVGETLWSDINAFAQYGFNKSHAISYGYISYQMAYLKTHYPLEFMCACLISDSDEEDKVIKYINYCRAKGTQVFGPSINQSDLNFTINDGAIRFGLLPIKNIGLPAQSIIDERKERGPFTSIIDFAYRIDLSKINRKKLESLILAGAFDEMGYSRQSQLDTVFDIYRWKTEQKSYESKLETYNKKVVFEWQRWNDIDHWNSLSKAEQQDARTRGEKKPSKVKEPQCPVLPLEPQQQVSPEIVEQDRLLQEREMLGCYISGHPLDAVEEVIRVQIEDIKEKAQNDQRTEIIAVPTSIHEITTKKTMKRMAYLVLEDKSGTMEAVILPNMYDKFQSLVDVKIPARYSLTIEVIEADEAKTVKGRIYKVEMLPSVRRALLNPTKIVVPIAKGDVVAQLLKNHTGNEFRIQLLLEVNGGTLCDMGVFKCAGDKSSLIKQIRQQR